MSLTSAQISDIVNDNKTSERDTGSPEVQVSLLTARIIYLTDHFKEHKKDVHSRRGLLTLVNKRKKLLKYLKQTESARYYSLIEKLNLRDSY